MSEQDRSSMWHEEDVTTCRRGSSDGTDDSVVIVGVVNRKERDSVAAAPSASETEHVEMTMVGETKNTRNGRRSSVERRNGISSVGTAQLKMTSTQQHPLRDVPSLPADPTRAVSELFGMSSNGMSYAPQRRRRMTTGGQLMAANLLPSTKAAALSLVTDSRQWNGFVSKGTQLKSFLDGALQHVASGYAATVSNSHNSNLLLESTNDESTAGSSKKRRLNDDRNEDGNNTEDTSMTGMPTTKDHPNERESAVASLAREKTAEVLLLQQKLEEANAQVAALTASNAALREESTANTLRFERTVEALKISSTNAATARADADQAEATASNMATRLEALQTVVQETKQASQLLYQEQQEISEQVRAGQAQLLQTQADLARSQKENKQLRGKTEEWQVQAQVYLEETQKLKRQLVEESEAKEQLKKKLDEMDAMEQARKERVLKVEMELREAQALLVDATSTASETEMVEMLKDNIQELQVANKKLHEQLVEQQEAASKDKARMHEALTKSEKEVQALKIQFDTAEDKMHWATLEKNVQEKQVDNLKSLLSEADRRLEELNKGKGSAVSPDIMATPHQKHAAFTAGTKSLNSSLSTPGGKENNNTDRPVGHCSICFKESFGLMKKCQCGNKSCDKKAHITCVKSINPGPSVSHPGTPAAKLPVVLCGNVLSSIRRRTIEPLQAAATSTSAATL